VKYWKAGGWTLGLVGAGRCAEGKVAAVRSWGSRGTEVGSSYMRALRGVAAGTIEADTWELGPEWLLGWELWQWLQLGGRALNGRCGGAGKMRTVMGLCAQQDDADRGAV